MRLKKAKRPGMGLSLSLYVLQWMLVAVVVACVSEGVAGADSGAVSQQEGAALCALLHSTRGDSWRWRPEAEAGAVWNCSVDAAGGLVHNPCSHGGSSWQGVTCSGTPAECSSQVCQVTQLDLTSYEMRGPIPPEIGNLTSLEILDLGSNSLTGSIPVSVGQLTALQVLFIFSNLLTGEIPVEIGQLTALQYLSLYSNELSGKIPNDVGQLTALKQFICNSNQLTGHIPVEIGNLEAVEVFFLYSNHLSGTIPSEVGQLAAVAYFYFFGNQITGLIPTEMGQLTTLQYLDLNTNQLMGSIPVELSYLSSLRMLSLHSNKLTGPIPVEIGQLTALRQLYLYGNKLAGIIPSELGQLTGLIELIIYSNNLLGTIPIELGQLAVLEHFVVSSNRLSGPIPSEVGQLLALKHLVLSSNRLTGIIPVEVGQLVVLEYLVIFDNHLSGPIPVEVGQLTALEHLVLSSNQLSGIIPKEVGTLTSLQQMYIYSNHLTGSIPVEIGQVSFLEYLYLYNNRLTGPVPADLGKLIGLEFLSLFDNHLTGLIPAEFGQLAALKYVAVHSNDLSGTIPSSFGDLVSVDEVRLQDNVLSGSLPREISKLRNLRILFLQNNMLTGQLDGIFNHSTQGKLSTFDISNNRLQGALASELFLLPELQVLSLSVNCFDKELPENLCSAEHVEVLSLNGLRAAEGCEDRAVVPLTSVALFNTIGGTVPPCVWALRNLTVLHLVGNGLSGQLVGSLPALSQLSDVTLSHNQLTGTIPLDFLKVTKLDLSFNEFAGEYADRTQSFLDSEIDLEINRLSGQLPAAGLERVLNGSLSVLRGNMFSCNTIPSRDTYSSDYVCGSQHLNYALVVFASAIGVITCVIVMIYWSYHAKAGNGDILFQRSYVTYLQNLDMTRWKGISQILHKVSLLSDSFREVMSCATQLLGVVLIGSSSLYIVKLMDSNGAYSTHSNTYAWFWTLSYMRGVVPACMLFVVWAVAIISCYYRVVTFERRMRFNDDSKSTIKANADSGDGVVDMNFRYICDRPILVSFAFNICITLTVNTCYIYLTQQALTGTIQFGLQLSLSLFRLVYAMVALPILSRSIDNMVVNIRFRFILLMINNLMIPCLVTALTSDACFQGLLIQADTVSTPYAYRTCLGHTTNANTGVTLCMAYGTEEVESAPLIPPFTYNNQCGSVLLTSYIPVLLLGYSIQLLLSWILVALQVHMSYESFPSSIRSSLHGLMWPEYWRQGGDTLVHNKATVSRFPTVLLQIRTIFCNDILNNWLLLMTFGLCSPILAVAIVCCLLLKMSLWVILVGRYTKCVLQVNAPFDERVDILPKQPLAVVVGVNDIKNSVSFALIALAQTHISLFTVLAHSFWRVAWCSALFVALLSWDMAADEVGWLMSLWIPLLPFVVITSLHSLVIYLHGKTNREMESLDVNIATSKDASGCVSSVVDESRSPLHVDSSTVQL